MHNEANGVAARQALPNAVAKTLAYLDAPRRLLGTWIWNPDRSKRPGKRLVLSWRSHAGSDRRTIKELRRMSDHQLADIGLSRSDLTLEGLAIASSRRTRRQDLIATEVSRLRDAAGGA